MDKQQFHEQLTKTFLPRSSPKAMVWGKALLRERERERERERVNNARGILYRQNFNKHPFWGAFCNLLNK